jgi:hypothetical protein
MSAHVRISERAEKRHRLGRLEGEVEARRARPGTAGATHELGAIDRIAAVQDGAKVIDVDNAGETERDSAALEPAPGLLALPQ